ncbi:disulfide bond formation protein B [Gilvimarinus sp. SDUM040013]|uniref:Disulfide bond formation protein B n=1 Tax=Gilvimarinus gilvus TaxID=3058038 RepID=A0ABU4S1P2_9GAMM|nr:disulfide bond formation protein B [Gilvimarinus sp. SDUM040013]MDO3384818.1 disulfide bond formation protein B [Gilvimarinus sp. SDUM040013]MDX6850849.1 disulfide bond formation protein B [Gilvimarinus sp. SDUM040013]
MSTPYIQRLFSLASCRYFWVAVALAMLALEGGALYFQHVEKFYPCELCIYVRVWVALIFLVSVIALWIRKWLWGRIAASLTGLVLSLGLAMETWGLIKVEYGIGNGGACGYKANFPDWAPLDSWLPAVFEVQDLCQATPLVLGPISMTHGLVLVSIGLVLAMSVALMGCVRRVAE